MPLYAETGSLIGQPFPGIEILNIGSGLDHTQFTKFVSSLVLPHHFGEQGELIDARPAQLFERDIVAASRTPEKPRDPWAPDHHWHYDGGYSGGTNQFASVLYAQMLQGDEVAGTEFIDTAALLSAIEVDHSGLSEELIKYRLQASVGRYFRQILPSYGGDAEAAIQRTLSAKGVSTLSEAATLEERRYPPKHFPAIAIHPFRQKERCLMIDMLNVVHVLGALAVREAEILNLVRKEYLELPKEELSQRPYYYRHTWEPGQVVIFPQVGTLHRAEPSPAGELRRDTLRLFIA